LFDIAELGKSREQFFLRGLEAEIADKNLAHDVLVITFKLSRWGFEFGLANRPMLVSGGRTARGDRSGKP
jgi:hypothetical protein